MLGPAWTCASRWRRTQAAMVHPTVRIASFDDWKVVEEKAWVVLGGFFLGFTVIYKVTKKVGCK